MTRTMEYIEWLDVWAAGADRADLPRLLLIGDSIARSYYAHVDKALEGRYYCARICTSARVCDPVYFCQLAVLLDEFRFDVVHFNNGLHGGGYTAEEYRAGLERAWDFIAAHAPGARLMWAASTPVRYAGHPQDLHVERTAWVQERNRVAAEVAAGRGIAVDDLFTPVVGHPEYFSDDGVHYNAAGVAVLGDTVLSALAPLLG